MTEIIKLTLNEIKPYWRNPRVIGEEAVNLTMQSIERYGYQQPIIVDKNMVIIAGHTRYAALRQLGVEEVPVIVSDLDAKQANEYRVIDNRTAEYSKWDNDLLVQELREVSDEVLTDYFPNIDLGLDFDALDLISMDEIKDAEERILGDMGSVPEETIEFVCPHCFTGIELPASRFRQLMAQLG